MILFIFFYPQVKYNSTDVTTKRGGGMVASVPEKEV